MLPFRRSVAGSSALARRYLRILGNRPTAAILPANRLASASDHRAHAALQPADCLILLPQRPPAVTSVKLVEIRDCGSRRPDAVAPVAGCLQSVRLRAAIDGMADCAAGAVPLSSPAPDGAPLRGCGA